MFTLTETQMFQSAIKHPNLTWDCSIQFIIIWLNAKKYNQYNKSKSDCLILKTAVEDKIIFIQLDVWHQHHIQTYQGPKMSIIQASQSRLGYSHSIYQRLIERNKRFNVTSYNIKSDLMMTPRKDNRILKSMDQQLQHHLWTHQGSKKSTN